MIVMPDEPGPGQIDAWHRCADRRQEAWTSDE